MSTNSESAASGEVVQELLLDFLSKSHVDRNQEFEDLCESHPECAKGLRRLWAAHRRVHEGLLIFDELRGEQEEPCLPQGAQVGDTIGDFRLLRAIARGGMGEVWEAEQVSLQRRVALKLVLPDRINEKTLALFAREARAGGRLAHKGIVAVHGYGQDGGRHWIAQELIAGAWTLRNFIDEVRSKDALPENYYAGVTIFVAELADALQAAHDAQIIHRDVKPQNVLVTPDNHPKLTDFGLARITDESALSVSGDLAGTWLYMSPEQVSASRTRVDHRTDIFSLGIVMYEMLALQRPFDGDTSHQIAENIVHKEAPDLRKLRSRVPRDLAVICAHALEKRPVDRYSSMGEFAQDLRRHLANEPIHAQPPTLVERSRKWVRRNPARSAAAVLTAVAFTVISGLSLQLARKNEDLRLEQANLAKSNSDLKLKTEEAERETARAELNAAEAERQTREVELERGKVVRERDRLDGIVRFHEGAFAKLDPEKFGLQLRKGLEAELVSSLETRGREADDIQAAVSQLKGSLASINFTNLGVDTLGQQHLDPTRKRITLLFKDDPITQASLRFSLAASYSGMGFHKQAGELLRQLYEQRLEHLGEEDADTLVAMSRLATSLEREAKYEESQALFERALELQRKVLGEGDLETLQTLHSYGRLLESKGDYEAAMQCFLEVRDRAAEFHGANNAFTISILDSLGGLCFAMGNFDEALEYAMLAVEKSARLTGEGREDALTYANNLAVQLESLGRFEEAGAIYTKALPECRQVFGDENSLTLKITYNLGCLIMGAGELEKARPYLEASLEGTRAVWGPLHPDTLASLNSMGTLLTQMRKPEEALPYLQGARDGLLAVRGPDHDETINSTNGLASTLFLLGRVDEALPLFEDLLATSQRVSGEHSLESLFYMGNLGFAYMKAGQLDKAHPLLESAYEKLCEKYGKNRPETLASEGHLAALYVLKGDLNEAQRLFKDGLKRAKRKLPETHVTRRFLKQELKALYELRHLEEPERGWDKRAAEL